MILYWTAPVISYDVDGIGLDLARRKVPIARELAVRLVQFFSVDEKLSFAKLNLFTFKSDHSFQQHHPLPCKTDHHDVSPPGG